MPPPEDAIEFLKMLGADTIAHKADRNLLAHLTVTYDLLNEWGHNHDVALAGLFHSIYGTTGFDHACVTPDRRVDIRRVIGAPAERLAYFFSAMQRDDFLERLGKNVLLDRFADREIALDDTDTKHLAEILFANELDLAIVKKGRNRPDKIAKKAGPIFHLLNDYLSPAARTAYHNVTRPV